MSGHAIPAELGQSSPAAEPRSRETSPLGQYVLAAVYALTSIPLTAGWCYFLFRSAAWLLSG